MFKTWEAYSNKVITMVMERAQADESSLQESWHSFDKLHPSVHEMDDLPKEPNPPIEERCNVSWMTDDQRDTEVRQLGDMVLYHEDDQLLQPAFEYEGDKIQFFRQL
jgi:hypothetical protein